MHLLCLIYISLSLPLIIGFDQRLDVGLMTWEVITIIESVLFLVVNIIWHRSHGTSYLKHGLVFDIFACSPFVVALDG
jgi:hypothetical protein